MGAHRLTIVGVGHAHGSRRERDVFFPGRRRHPIFDCDWSSEVCSSDLAFGGRAALGLATITLTAGIASWKPEGQNARATSYGATAAFRLIGGSLIPVSVNLQVGAGHNARGTSGADTVPASTTVLGAVGLSVPLPTPGISLEPYLSPGIRYHKQIGRAHV